MRTLKKTLCLVLALVMVLGVCAFGASAEFTDADEINYAEAVAVLSGIGVINGIEDADGNFAFQPAGTLTRAQAAKIITFIDKADDLKATANFTDTKGHWAESFIAYCASEGIVGGMGDGTFAPDATLTGSAWAKMLLCSLGFDADECGMTGADWEIGVAKMLKKTGLAKNIKGFDGTAGVSREAAAEMAFQALQYATEETAGYAVKNASNEVVGYYDTMIEAATAATVLGSGYTFDTLPTIIETNAKTADFDLVKAVALNANGENYYMWYVDEDQDGAFNPLKDTVVSDEYVTDKEIASFEKGAKRKDVVAAAGKKTSESLSVKIYINGNYILTDSWAGTSTDLAVTDSNATMTLVKTSATPAEYKALYEYTALYKVTAVTKLTGDDKGKANFVFTRQGGVEAQFGSVPSTVTVKADLDAYTKDAMYMGVAQSATKFTTVVEADAPVVAKVTATATGYVKCGDAKYAAANTNVSLPSNGQIKAFYLNAAGDVMLVATPDSAPTIYDGYVYVVASEYKATPGSLTGVLDDAAEATIVSKANIVAADGTASTVALATKIVPATATTPSKAQYWNGTAFADANADLAAHAAVAAGWYAYQVGEDGSYTLTAIAGLEKALTYATAKQAAITVGSDASFMTKDTVIKLVNYDAGKVTTTTITGYANVTLNTILNSKKAIVVANDSNVVSEITIYTAVAPTAATNYAIYVDLGENDAVLGQYYTFYVDGEIVSFLQDTTNPISGESLTAGDVASYVVTAGKVTACNKLSASATGETVAQIQDGYVVVGTSTIVYTAATMVVVDKTADNAVVELAVGDTITYFVNSTTSAIEFAVVTAHAA